jgi:hypothetical protein
VIAISEHVIAGSSMPGRMLPITSLPTGWPAWIARANAIVAARS